jgi:hypothetical protein
LPLSLVHIIDILTSLANSTTGSHQHHIIVFSIYLFFFFFQIIEVEGTNVKSFSTLEKLKIFTSFLIDLIYKLVVQTYQLNFLVWEKRKKKLVDLLQPPAKCCRRCFSPQTYCRHRPSLKTRRGGDKASSYHVVGVHQFG